MTQVQMGNEVIETDLPAEAVADLQQPAEPAEPAKVEEAPEQTANPEPVAEAPKVVEETPQPEPDVSRKPKPIASLLEKKHEAEERAAAAEARNVELEAQIAQLSQQPATPQNIEDVKQLAETYGLDEQLLANIVAVARKGVNPELPPEVQSLIAERQQERQQQEEIKAFNTRVDSLAKALPNEQFSDPKVRERLLELAYSTENAPDGEPYFKKELSELYFAYIKPEVEPGTVTAEGSMGGSKPTEILDFEDILNDESKMEEFAKTAPSDQWQAFTKWRDEKQPEKIIRKTLS